MQELKHPDFMLRVVSCLNFIEVLPQDLTKVIFSDEATFKTSGHVNTHNCRIWSTTRPDNFVQNRCQNPQKVTVFAAMTEDKLFGPYFFPGNVDGKNYFNF